MAIRCNIQRTALTLLTSPLGCTNLIFDDFLAPTVPKFGQKMEIRDIIIFWNIDRNSMFWLNYNAA